MSKDSFKFHVPISLQKGSDGKMRIGGIAATEDKDLQGEVVKLKGLDISALQEGRGVFNDDHRKGFENVVGIVDNARLDSDGLYVEGELLDNPKAKNIYNIMQYCQKSKKDPRVQMSIEGKIMKRSGADKKIVSKAKVDKIALTLDPINRNTYADLIKSLILDGATQDQDSPSENNKSRDGDNPPSAPSLASYDSVATDGSNSTLTNDEIIKSSLDEESRRSLVTEIVSELMKAMEMQSQNYGDTLPKDMKNATATSTESLDSKKRKIKDIMKSLIEKYPNVDLSRISEVVYNQLKQKEKS